MKEGLFPFNKLRFGNDKMSVMRTSCQIFETAFISSHHHSIVTEVCEMRGNVRLSCSIAAWPVSADWLLLLKAHICTPERLSGLCPCSVYCYCCRSVSIRPGVSSILVRCISYVTLLRLISLEKMRIIGL